MQRKALCPISQAYTGYKGLLTLGKEEKKGSGDHMLTGVCRTHALYTEFRCGQLFCVRQLQGSATESNSYLY